MSQSARPAPAKNPGTGSERRRGDDEKVKTAKDKTAVNGASGHKSMTVTIVVFALTVVVILAVCYATVIIMEQNAYRAGERIVANVVDRIDGTTGEVETVTRQTAGRAMELLDSPAELEKLIHEFVSADDNVMGSTIAFEPDVFPEYGRCFAPYSWETGGGVKDRQLGEETDYYSEEWYAEAKAGRCEYWCEPYFDEGGAKIMMCTFSVPITDSDGNVTAVLTADIGLDDLDDYISTINPYSDSDIILRSAKGAVLAQNKRESANTANCVIVRGETEIGWSAELELPVTYLLHGNVSMFTVIGSIILVAVCLVMLVYGILRRIQDRAEEERVRQTKISLDREKEFRSVLTEAADGFLQANLSKNVIEGEITDVSSDGEKTVHDPVKLCGSSGYDEFIRWWAENGQVTDIDEFLKVSNCAYLISRFEQGQTMVNVLSAFKNDKGEPRVWRQENYLYRDSISGDICSYCVVWDITEEKEMERNLEEALKTARSANEAKSNFLFNMSHDIRTPMNAIIGYTSMAKKCSSDPKMSDYLEKIDLSGKQLLSLVNQVLEMSRIESGKVTLSEEPINIDNLAKGLETIVSADMSAKGISYSFCADNIQHREVLTDVSRINQIIVNIAGNAVKYTPEGGHIDCTIVEEPCDKEGYGLYVTTFADTGIGMSEEYLEHIFEEFTREKSSTVSKIQGTGLGMSIVKKLIDLMGGTIDVKSKLGKGTTITIAVPMKWNTDAVTPDAAGDSSAGISLEGMRVLLVEDNEMNREIATEILEEAGVVVEPAEDGDVAVEILKTLAKEGDYGYYDAVLMDIQMPRMNGYEATKAIREILVPKGLHLPIIALSANAFEEDRKKSLEAGMDGHVAKPIDTKVLMTVLAEILHTGK